jgi:hypothetical protein
VSGRIIQLAHTRVARDKAVQCRFRR